MKKFAYFTIDDSPSILMKDFVDLLLKKNIPALFFCQGNHMEQFPQHVIYAIQKGFMIGNHSYSHPKFSDISIKECLEEISRTELIIDRLYKEANVERGKKYFRYPKGIKADIPYGSMKIFFKHFNKKFNTIEKHLKHLGYEPLRIKRPKYRYPVVFSSYDTDCFWTLDIAEWKIRHKSKNYSIKDVMAYLQRKLDQQSRNEIFLAHDHEMTHVFFEEILDFLNEKEYKFLDIPK